MTKKIFNIWATAKCQDREHTNNMTVMCAVYCRYGSVDLLVKDEVRGKVEHLSIGVFVGAPAEAEGGQTHP